MEMPDNCRCWRWAIMVFSGSVQEYTRTCAVNNRKASNIKVSIGIVVNHRRRTPGYIIFYILFLPDSWQVVIGLICAYYLTPVILSPDMSTPAVAMLYIMIATIGYAASRGPARGISRLLKKLVLGDRQP